MSTETQRADFGEPTETEILKSQLFSLRQMYHGLRATKASELETLKAVIGTYEKTTASQAAEIEALKAKLASYEAHGVTCQTFGHVVGACAECNTHEESKEAEIAALKADIATYVRAASEQATEIGRLNNELDSAYASYESLLRG